MRALSQYLALLAKWVLLKFLRSCSGTAQVAQGLLRVYSGTACGLLRGCSRTTQELLRRLSQLPRAG
jgi:hypothetical protein